MKKSPLELNAINNYLWNKQGKRHFWGIKGKDYGLLQSLNNNRVALDENNGLQMLKDRHISFNQNQYDQRNNQRNYEENHKLPYRNYEKAFLDAQQYRNQYSTEKPQQHYKVRTQPIQSHEQQQQYPDEHAQNKKRHLSLMSKNIQISNSQTPKINHNKRISSIDYAQQLQKQHQQEGEKKAYKRMNTEGNINDYEMKKYRERIVKVVKRDRKNNPTFCNSLAYPLHCYRYVQ